MRNGFLLAPRQRAKDISAIMEHNMIHTTQECQIGDNVELMQKMPSDSVDTIITSPPYWGTVKYGGHQYIHMENTPRDKKTGRFLAGNHYSPSTEFKDGQHWRDSKPYWKEEWLFNEYVVNGKSADQIAQENDCTANNILYFIDKFGIRTRTMSEIRAKKHWGSPGEQNGMYGRCGEDNPHWLGGISPERQAFYASSEWSDIVKMVWKRDNATCVRCGAYKATGVVMHIHHITTFAIESMRYELDNLMLTCKKCHNWIHSKKNTNEYFIARPIKDN